jgi:hypothetical protein
MLYIDVSHAAEAASFGCFFLSQLIGLYLFDRMY